MSKEIENKTVCFVAYGPPCKLLIAVAFIIDRCLSNFHRKNNLYEKMSLIFFILIFRILNRSFQYSCFKVRKLLQRSALNYDDWSRIFT